MIALVVVLVALLLAVGHAASQSVTITAFYPRKLDLFLRGNDCGLNWNKGLPLTRTEMQPHQLRGSNSTGYAYSFVAKCDLSPDRVLAVKALVGDSTWMIGSNHHIQLSAQTSKSEFYPWFYTSQGTTEITSQVYSPQLKNFRDVITYLPPSYLENPLKVHRNVLIMHDGQNLFDPRTSAFGTAWMVQDTVNPLVVQGAMDEVLIIGPYNTPDRMNEYTYVYDPSEKAGGKGDLYLDFLHDTLLPQMAKKYRMEVVRDRLGIMGSSLGGLISCYGGWTRGVYGKVGCMSSSFWWDDQDYQQHVITQSVPAAPLPAFYMDGGTEAGGEAEITEDTLQVYAYMTAHGFTENVDEMKYVDPGAAHNEASWGKRLHVPMQFLYPPSTV